MILKVDLESMEFRHLADFLGDKAFPCKFEGWEGLDKEETRMDGLGSFARLISAKEVEGMYRVVLEVDEVTDISGIAPKQKREATIPRDAILALFDALGLFPAKQEMY